MPFELTDRDYAHFHFEDVDLEAQLLAIRAALAGFWARTARAPRAADLRTDAWHGPTAATIRRRYGTIERAWDLLGPVPVSPD